MGGERRFSTIRTLIDRNAMLYPDRVAMKDVDGHGEYTYKNLKERVNRMGNALYALGARKGDRVAILGQNSSEYIESAVSVPNAGLIYVVCNFRLAPPEIAAVLSDAEPSILIVQEQFIQIAKGILSGIPSVQKIIYFGSPRKGRKDGSITKSLSSTLRRLKWGSMFSKTILQCSCIRAAPRGFPRASCRPMAIFTMRAGYVQRTMTSLWMTVSSSSARCIISPRIIPSLGAYTRHARLISFRAGISTCSSKCQKRKNLRRACSQPRWL